MVKFRIDKIPKNDKDMEEIQREVEETHHQHEHEHGVEELLSELYLNLQSMQGKVDELSKTAEDCKKEISKLYLIISKLLIALTTRDQNEKIQNLKDILGLLE
ncbi:hypothetical protein BFU36_02980 [Sulfolobus sp. A20]|uniref:hypothetical protein n=1 Tax=Sulfolobaceae TaxID=118883 RepID=UPI000845D667|nr:MULTISPECIES: hypothetical protein [unclassified Sulfolobus]TRM76479.1 hypothetical protein DJ523_01020 [Sulfolobus sp. E5]TRM76708.1 hypothetical protein DJ532_06825 [Sulfolobus sp. A20-N-F8]TRM76918.1 hypothetical protein DJ528_07660 [Sulfolobus sp. B5]TRM80553.1 hypothetical protein DJ531_12120 [Sulfolobus sp. A20-N-F6]TRM87770.1 hypothetical protein DJ529_07400 [Sulfolobus sp. C3]TRM93359.1 hypothetical protein DJ526_04145 [Sulfolobus sp. A20-N-G8]TRM96943.1 hypothetical protein DJ527